MTIRLTPSQARRLGLNIEAAVESPEAPKRRKVTTHSSPAPVESQKPVQGYTEGIVGLHRHRFQWVGKYDGWVSVCGIGITVKQPDGGGEGVECVRCYGEEA